MVHQRNVHLALTPLAEARAQFLSELSAGLLLPGETIDVGQAVGRTLAEPALAHISSPAYAAAAMDGVAVRAVDTEGASEGHPVELAVPRQALWVNTGDPIPLERDAVVMVERVRSLGHDRVAVGVAARPWQHVRRVGEDILAGATLLARNHLVTPTCLGGLLLGGISQVVARRQPRVLVQPTGAEIVTPSAQAVSALRPGQILDCNSFVLGALVTACGGVPTRADPIPDDAELLALTLRRALTEEHDLVLVIGGSSAGAGDFTREAVAAVGRVVIHGIAMTPGKPTVLGVVAGKPVIGIPGYPVSAMVAFAELVRPTLLAMLGRPNEPATELSAVTSESLGSKLGVEELVRVRLGRVGRRLVAAPLPRRAGSVTSVTQADAIVRLGPDCDAVSAGEPVVAELLRSRAEIEQTAVYAGADDPSLERLDDLLRQRQPGFRLSVSPVGGEAGLRALAQRLCHVAGASLGDSVDGGHGRAQLGRHLAGAPVRSVHLAVRQQGLIVAPGNPHQLAGLTDLARRGLRVVLRPVGTGTRTLFDAKLGELGLDAVALGASGPEEPTQRAAAAAVASGAADVTLGVAAAARAFALDFVPLLEEPFELFIAAELMASAPIVALLATLRSRAFRDALGALGGYRADQTGAEVPL